MEIREIRPVDHAALVALCFSLPGDGPGFACFLDVTAAGVFAAVCDVAQNV